MKNIIAFAITATSICCAAPAQDPAPARSKEVAPKKVTRNWSPKDKLPLLRAAPVAPKRDVKLFAKESYGFSYRRDRDESKVPKEAPFATDELAITAARKWITYHYGELPKDVSLKATKVLHSSSGRSKPAFGSDIGHTITFRSFYRGIPTDRSTIIYINGKTTTSASIDLRRYTPLKKPERIVDAETAKQAWRKIFAARKDAASILKEFDAKANPKLFFVWSLKSIEVMDGSYDILAPTWTLDNDLRILVDGHSGKPRFDD